MLKKMSAILLTMVLLLSMIPLTPALAAGVTSLPSYWSEQEWGVLLQTNQERMKAGLLPLSSTENHQKAGRVRANELVEMYSHTRPGGYSCFSALTEQGVSYTSAEENIAEGYSTAAAATKGWMGNSGHQANILNSGFVHLGTGYSSGNGYTHHWVQLFTGGCYFTGISMVGTSKALVFEKGTAIEDMGLAAALTCPAHGTSYMPLISPMCTGFFPNVIGKTAVTVAYGSLNTSFTVEITDGPVTPAYSVIFDKGSGSGSWDTLLKAEGSIVTISAKCAAAFKRKNYLFSHFLGSDGKEYKSGAKITITGDLTLTAKYTKVSVKKASAPKLSKESGKIRVRYDKVSGADGYQFAVSTSKTFASGKGGSKSYVGYKKNYIQTCAGKALKSGATYYVKIRAYTLDSQKNKIWGSFSAVNSIRF